MNKTQIQNFNENLVNAKIDINIVDYVKKINEKFFKIDISFIDDFIDLVNNDGFIIHHEMLFKYDILSRSDSSQVLRLLENSNFEINIDYVCTRAGVDDGRVTKNIYMLNSDTFKMICMRTIKTKKYAQYYILLEKAIKHYNEYQLLKQQDKIDRLENTLKDRVILPSSKRKLESLVIVYLNNDDDDEDNTDTDSEFPYYVIRGQRKHILAQLRRLNKTEDDVIASIETPNSVDFWIKIKEQMDEYLKLDKMVANNKIIMTSYFAIKGISEKEFIKRINKINIEKFSY